MPNQFTVKFESKEISEKSQLTHFLKDLYMDLYKGMLYYD